MRRIACGTVFICTVAAAFADFTSDGQVLDAAFAQGGYKNPVIEQLAVAFMNNYPPPGPEVTATYPWEVLGQYARVYSALVFYYRDARDYEQCMSWAKHAVEHFPTIALRAMEKVESRK